YTQMLTRNQGMFFHCGVPVWLFPTAATVNISIKPATIASVTDGTSNTLFFGEKAHNLFSPSNGNNANTFFGWWTSPDMGDTMFNAFFPPNYFKGKAADYNPTLNPLAPGSGWPRYCGLAISGGGGSGTVNPGQLADDMLVTASSNHPGGANF